MRPLTTLLLMVFSFGCSLVDRDTLEALSKNNASVCLQLGAGGGAMTVAPGGPFPIIPGGGYYGYGWLARTNEAGSVIELTPLGCKIIHGSRTLETEGGKVRIGPTLP